MKQNKEKGKFKKLIYVLKELSLNILVRKAKEQLSGNTRFMKELVTKKSTVIFEDVSGLYYCIAITSNSLA